LHKYFSSQKNHLNLDDNEFILHYVTINECLGKLLPNELDKFRKKSYWDHCLGVSKHNQIILHFKAVLTLGQTHQFKQ